MRRGYRTTIRLALWVLSIVAVLVVGLVFFPREYKGITFWEAFYSTLRLFVFERDLEPFPRAWPLILIYFAAPAIALSALGTAISYLFRLSPAIRARWFSDHVIVCGVGRTGKLLASTLHDKGVKVVGVDLCSEDEFEEWRAEHKVPMVYGNFHSRSILERAGAKRARSIVFACGDDLANLEGAVGLYEWLEEEGAGPKIIWTHISTEKLAETARGVVKCDGPVDIRFFDTYHIAAAKMIAKHFSRSIREGVTEVTILGFGKFGRDLFEVLARDLGPEEMMIVKIADRADRSEEVRKLAGELGIEERTSFLQADIHHMELVDEVDHAFFLCTDDDLGNLTAAMMLAGKADATHVYVRMNHWPLAAVADHLGEDRGVVFVNINDLVCRGIKDLPGIFEPAG